MIGGKKWPPEKWLSIAEWRMSFAVVIAALDETWSLHETIDTLVDENPGEIAEIFIATAPRATAACRAACEAAVAKRPSLVRVHEQNRLPGVGGAIRECFELVNAEWGIMMAADLETPPAAVKTIIACARQGDADIVATSRWMAGGSFGDYKRIKLLCNWIFQKGFSLLYWTPLTDMTYGYRAFRREILSRYRWRETGHAFFMESLCIPLRDGKRVVEVPVQWRSRQEGISHIKASEFFRYFRVGFALRFVSKKKFLAEPPHGG